MVRRRRDQRGDCGWTARMSGRRSPRRNSFPSQDRRRTYALVIRGGQNGEGDFFLARQWSRRREQLAADHYGARQGSRTGHDRRFERRPAQNHWYVKPTRIERAGLPVNKIPSDDPDFSAKVCIIHRLIKAVRHLKNVSRDI